MQEKIESYVRSKLPGAKVTGALRMGGGVGEEEWSFRAEWPEGPQRLTKELVVKLHQPGGPLSDAGDQIAEGNVLRCLEPTPIPVPKIYWVETDTKWLGGPFFIMDKVDGTHSTRELRSDPQLRARFTQEFIQILATLHTLDWEQLGVSFLGVPRNAEDCAARELQKWGRIYRSQIIVPQPLLDKQLRWLADHIPKHVERISLLWGDPGPGNVLHQNGKITACLDWELTHLGDPMDELGYLIYKHVTVGEPFDQEQFLGDYERLSGIKVNLENIKYYVIMSNVRIAIAAQTAAHDFCAGTALSLFAAMMGLNTLHGNQKEAAALIGL